MHQMNNAREFLLTQGFNQLCKGMPQSEILKLMGEPTRSSVETIPLGSGWGEQEAFWIKIPAGHNVLEWSYPVDNGTITLWFAKTDKDWSIALKVKLPLTVKS